MSDVLVRWGSDRVSLRVALAGFQVRVEPVDAERQQTQGFVVEILQPDPVRVQHGRDGRVEAGLQVARRWRFVWLHVCALKVTRLHVPRVVATERSTVRAGMNDGQQQQQQQQHKQESTTRTGKDGDGE